MMNVFKNPEIFIKDFRKVNSFYEAYKTQVKREKNTEEDILRFNRYVEVLEGSLTVKLKGYGSIQKFEYLKDIYGALIAELDKRVA